jgi:hypothetical protein
MCKILKEKRNYKKGGLKADVLSSNSTPKSSPGEMREGSQPTSDKDG